MGVNRLYRVHIPDQSGGAKMNISIPKMIKYIRSKGYSYVMIEKLGTVEPDKPDSRTDWRVHAENLDLEEDNYTEEFDARTLHGAMSALYRWVRSQP